jgi:MFS family permease
VPRIDELNARKPLWPVASLVILCGLNLLDYLDRTILGGVLPLLRKDLNLTYAQGGALATAFLLGYFVTSPLFGYLGDRLPRRWLVAAGVFVWSFGTLMSGHASAFVSLLCFRALVGFGEASFGTISPGWIADLFPPGKRNNAITVFYFAIPVGSAIGYVLGGWIAVRYGWRAAFLCAGYPGLLLAALMFLLREPPRGATESPSSPALAEENLGWRAYLQLAKYPVYVLVVLGYAAQTFAIGGFQVWAPTFLHEMHKMELEAANLFFGGTLAVTGLVSTLAGGFTATRWQQRTGAGYAGMLAASGVASAPLAFAAFLTPDPFLCKVFLALSMFMLFLSAGPVNTLIIETVPVRMRATSMAASIFAIHMLGDLWSPMIVGRLADSLGDIRLAVLWSLPVALVVCAVFWCWLVLWVKRSRVAAVSA